MIRRKIFLFSLLLSGGLITLLAFQWTHEANDQEKVEFQLHNAEIVAQELRRYEKSEYTKLVTIPTGIFIESFFSRTLWFSI